MATNKRQLRIACVGMDADNERPIISAVEMTSSRLGVNFDWSTAAQADICIVNVAAADPTELDAVVIRYSERQNGRAVDLVRPVRVGQLIGALQQAITTLDQRLAAAAAAPKPRRYRGQIIEADPRDAATRNVADSTPQSTPPPGKKTVIYRGVRITR